MPQLSFLARALEKYKRVEKIAHDFGVGETLYPSEIHMISTVATAGDVSITDLAEKFGNTKGAASQMVAKLVKRGFLEKSRDPVKKSRVLVTATPKGVRAHDHHMVHHAEHDKAFFTYLAKMNDEEYLVFDSLCRQMDLWMGSYFDQEDKPKPRE